MDPNKRYLFTSLMGCSGSAVVQTPKGNVNIGIDGMTRFLVVNIPGFRSEWDKFIMEPTPRVHKVLERADIAGDTTTIELLLSGRRSSADDVVDEDQIAFLQFYVLNAQICFKQFCNASGCNRIASKHCGKCRVAKYCSRECQVGDWRATHKNSCASLSVHP